MTKPPKTAAALIQLMDNNDVSTSELAGATNLSIRQIQRLKVGENNITPRTGMLIKFAVDHLIKKKQAKKIDWDHKELANRLYGIFEFNVDLIRNWGFYLYSPEFDKEEELRNRIGVIWLISLLDSIAAEEKTLSSCEARAEELGIRHYDDVLKVAQLFTDTTKEVLKLYTKEEQVFLIARRNMLVHGYLEGTLKQNFGIKYFDGVKIQTPTVNWDQYYAMIAPFEERVGKGEYHPLMKELLHRALRVPNTYWNAVERLHSNGMLQHLHRKIYAGVDGQPIPKNLPVFKV